jgi:glycosyltransferase involved in cell wall biosynthesis
MRLHRTAAKADRDKLMSLRIAQIAPLWTRLPPATYGGIELMVHLLTEELVRRGHEVTLFAAGDSVTSARLEPVVQRNLIDVMAEDGAHDYLPYAQAAVGRALEQSRKFDLLHFHLGCAFVPLSYLSAAPVLHSVQTVVTIDDSWTIQRYPDVTVVFQSQHQSSVIPPEGRANLRIISNACNFDAYELSPRAGRYLAFLGRISAHKNPIGAIDIARHLDMPIVLGGAPITQEERRYFAEHVQPRIDGKQVRYLGPVDHARKNELLRNAAALLFPIQWPEPFGIVMVEAMACGTPVVACRRGAVPEVVDPGRTGYYGDSVEALAPLVPKALELDRRDVRAWAMRRFDHRRMADAYLGLYRTLIARGHSGLAVARQLEAARSS